MDHTFIERLLRSVKYEEIYIREHATLLKLERGLTRWFERYNTWHCHEAWCHSQLRNLGKLPATLSGEREPPRSLQMQIITSNASR